MHVISQEIDVERLGRWLVTRVGNPNLVINRVHRLSGGRSNLTYRVDTSDGKESRPYLLRTNQGQGLAPKYDLEMQFSIQHSLHGAGLPVPDAYWLETDRAILGSEFWVGEFLPSEPGPRLFDWADPLALLRLKSFCQTLVQIHSVDWNDLNLQSWCPRMDLAGVNALLEGYISRGSPYMTPEDEAFLQSREWIQAHYPDHPVCLNHGDCSISNYLFDGPRVSGVVDWELSVLGDPLMDVAYYCSILWRRPGTGEDDKRRERDQFLRLYADYDDIDTDRLRFWEITTLCKNGLSWIGQGPPEESARAVAQYRGRLISLLEDR